MKKIVEKLMDYGMPFEYDNMGSDGEIVESFVLCVKISNCQGKLYLTHLGEMETMEETLGSYYYILRRIEDLCIEETASF